MTFWVTSSVPAGAAAGAVSTGADTTGAAVVAATTGVYAAGAATGAGAAAAAAVGSGMPALPRIHPATCLIVGKSRSFIVSSRSTL